MSKNRIIISIILLLLFLSFPLFPSSIPVSAQQSEELKIAVVDFNRLFYEYSLTVRQYIQLKNEKDALEKYISEKRVEIANSEETYKEQQQFFDDGRKREELLKIWMKVLELEIKIKEETAALQQKEENITEQINNLITPVIEDTRKDLGYDIIINKNSVFSAGSEVKDITDHVLNILTKS